MKRNIDRTIGYYCTMVYSITIQNVRNQYQGQICCSLRGMRMDEDIYILRSLWWGVEDQHNICTCNSVFLFFISMNVMCNCNLVKTKDFLSAHDYIILYLLSIKAGTRKSRKSLSFRFLFF